jgi:hypothetical protein
MSYQKYLLLKETNYTNELLRKPFIQIKWQCLICSLINENTSECDACGVKKPEEWLNCSYKDSLEVKKSIQENTCDFLNKEPSLACSIKHKIFYLYTTGIGDWGGLKIIEQWVATSSRKLDISCINSFFFT